MKKIYTLVATIIFLSTGCESIVVGLSSKMVGDLVLEKFDKEEKEKLCKQ